MPTTLCLFMMLIRGISNSNLMMVCFASQPFANGLAPCPRLFMKLMKPVLADLGKRGILITGFIDDKILIMKAV